jgi:hypothetical protein
VTAAWAAAAAAALLWPSHLLGALDGAPLNGRLEALLIGLVAPALLWFRPDVLRASWMRAAIGALLALKAASLTMTPQGLCARFSTDAPLSGVIQQIPVDEPRGVLRSWDVRADWRAENPACTAVIDRPYDSAPQFPAWFLNVLDYLRPGSRRVAIEATGFVDATEPGVLEWRVGEDVRIESGQRVELAAGVQRVDLRGTLTGERWQLVPLWNGRDAWSALTFTQRAPGPGDVLAPAIGLAISMVAFTIVAGWAVTAAAPLAVQWPMLAWTVAATGVAVVLASDERFARLTPLAFVAAAAVPVATRHRHLKSAFVLVGIPWLALFAARGWDQIGRFTIYSADDWLTYQVAGARIFMHGYWLQGGTAAFDYQPLYRWMSGALHVVFGDSSVGEVFSDAAWLLVGALLAFHLTRARAGFRWGVVAAALTLATFTIGTSWYFLGRGLSEIAAAGWAFLAMFFMLRARLGRVRASCASGIYAVLMFYTRLNHLLFAAFLPGLLLPLRTSSALASVRRAVARLRSVSLAVYAGVFALGVFAFMARTWIYTGSFSLFYGTSLRHNDTGLRPWTLFDAEVWRSVAHSVANLVFMNEPPSPDPRAVVVMAGCALAAGALLQVPGVRRLPAGVVVATIGATFGSFFAHTHNYPGRLTIHLVPLASALAVVGAALWWKRMRGTVRT